MGIKLATVVSLTVLSLLAMATQPAFATYKQWWYVRKSEGIYLSGTITFKDGSGDVGYQGVTMLKSETYKKDDIDCLRKPNLVDWGFSISWDDGTPDTWSGKDEAWPQGHTKNHMSEFITFGEPSVGGIAIPVDKFGLLAPYIGLASTLIAATAATAIYFSSVKHRKEKQ